MEEYELDIEELEPTKPYSEERAAEISEIMSEIASLLVEIND